MSRVLAAVVVTLSAAAPAAAQMEQPTPEQMQAAMAAMQPGPEHERLAGLVGEWDVELSYSMGPDFSQTIRATSTVSSILGGRFIVVDMKSPEMMMGMPIETKTIYGYDRRTGDYTILGLDTFGTYWVHGAGKGDVTTNPIVMPGSHVDPLTGRNEQYEFILRIIDTNTNESEIVFIAPDGQRFTAVKATARRK